MHRKSTGGLLAAIALLAAVVIVQATHPGETGGVAARDDLCPADIDNSGTVDVVDFLELLAAWGPCVCDASGAWSITPSISYSCAGGFLNINVSSWTFILDQDLLTVLGGPTTMTGPPVGCDAGNQFTVTGTVPGACTETYTLTGTFLDENTWDGTFTAGFTGGGCFDCTFQSWDITATRN